jgi:hypothetical protein
VYFAFLSPIFTLLPGVQAFTRKAICNMPSSGLSAKGKVYGKREGLWQVRPAEHGGGTGVRDIGLLQSALPVRRTSTLTNPKPTSPATPRRTVSRSQKIIRSSTAANARGS